MARRDRGARAGLPVRALRREADGLLYDVDEHRRVTIAELREDVQEGRRFRAVRHDSGADCTYEVLAELVGTAAVPRASPDGGILGALAQAAIGSAFTKAGGLERREDRRGRREK